MPVPMPLRKSTAPAHDPHHRAPADEPALAPRRTTAADHATSEAALRPGKDGQSPALVPPNAAMLAKTGPTRAALSKDIAEYRELAVQFMGYVSTPPDRNIIAKLVEPVVHAVAGVETPDYIAAFIRVKSLLMNGLGLLNTADAVLQRDDPTGYPQAVRLAKQGMLIVEQARVMEMDFGKSLTDFFCAENIAAAKVRDVSQAIVDADLLMMTLLTGGGLVVEGATTFVRGVGLSMLVGPSAAASQAAVHGEDPVRAGAAAAPASTVGGLAGGVVGPLLGGLAKPLTTYAAAMGPEISAMADAALGIGASTVSGGLVSGGTAALAGKDGQGIRDAAEGGAVRGALGKSAKLGLGIK